MKAPKNPVCENSGLGTKGWKTHLEIAKGSHPAHPVKFSSSVSSQSGLFVIQGADPSQFPTTKCVFQNLVINCFSFTLFGECIY